MPSAKLITRCRYCNFQAMRSKRLSASVYRRSFQSQSRMEPAALRQKGNKAPATAATQRLGPFSHATQQTTIEKRKERNRSAEGRDAYSNEVTAPTAVPQDKCSDTRHASQ
ncbi:hypothetical protein, unlikely [Trypanosoma congolense IL3000]|uniref:Uncharacterized protein n=1 Tax=Trypanosoma congolense (strain IL3000) TaxID=1068625 RepID=F9WBZ8_TRYCI|nr:hypothetical protein, unlikely [Trypanosoma congolense IL3000]